MTKVRKIAPVLSRMDVQGVVDEFLSFCKAQGLGGDSLRSNRYALQHFFGQHQIPLDDALGMKKAIGQMLQGRQDAYYNKQRNALRKFFVILELAQYNVEYGNLSGHFMNWVYCSLPEFNLSANAGTI